MIKFLFLIFLSLNCFAFQNGDLVFIKSQTSQSQALRDATGSEWTHVGIYYDNQVYESTGRTSLQAFIDRSKNSAVLFKRFKDFQDTQVFKSALMKYYKKPYDIYFEWSDDKIYCSEFVYKVYFDAFNVEVGELQKFKEMNLEAPSVKELIKLRYKNGKKFNEEETIVTPVSLVNSNKTYSLPITPFISNDFNSKW